MIYYYTLNVLHTQHILFDYYVRNPKIKKKYGARVYASKNFATQKVTPTFFGEWARTPHPPSSKNIFYIHFRVFYMIYVDKYLGSHRIDLVFLFSEYLYRSRNGFRSYYKF